MLSASGKPPNLTTAALCLGGYLWNQVELSRGIADVLPLGPTASGMPLDLPRACPPSGSQRHRSRALGIHRAPAGWLATSSSPGSTGRGSSPRPALRPQGLPRPGLLPAGTGSPTSRPACACTSPLPPGPGRAVRADSEYHRFGILAYLAARTRQQPQPAVTRTSPHFHAARLSVCGLRTCLTVCSREMLNRQPGWVPLPRT